MKKKIVCFGLGKIYQAFLSVYDNSKAEIVALSDNDAAKWILPDVIEPAKLKGSEFDYIVITSAYYREIMEQLCGYGIEEGVILPCDAEFVRIEKHYSGLYWGCSIAAFRGWAQENGYYYMGSNSAGNNAFFVRKDCIELEMVPVDANVFVESKYRESRDEKGNLTYLKGIDRLKCIKSMELFDLETKKIDTIENIYNAYFRQGG